MHDHLHHTEALGGYTIRTWTGVATDEGVGLIATVEVSDDRGVPVCRFEEFVADAVRRNDASWPRDRDASLKVLQERAVERAHSAILGGALQETHGHRYDVPG